MHRPPNRMPPQEANQSLYGDVSFDSPPNRSLYVQNVPKDATQNELVNLFSKHGTVESVKLCVNQKIGPQGVYAFVKFANHAHASAAIDKLKGYRMRDRELKVEYQRSQDRHEDDHPPSDHPKEMNRRRSDWSSPPRDIRSFPGNNLPAEYPNRMHDREESGPPLKRPRGDDMGGPRESRFDKRPATEQAPLQKREHPRRTIFLYQKICQANPKLVESLKVQKQYRQQYGPPGYAGHPQHPTNQHQGSPRQPPANQPQMSSQGTNQSQGNQFYMGSPSPMQSNSLAAPPQQQPMGGPHHPMQATPPDGSNQGLHQGMAGPSHIQNPSLPQIPQSSPTQNSNVRGAAQQQPPGMSPFGSQSQQTPPSQPQPMPNQHHSVRLPPTQQQPHGPMVAQHGARMSGVQHQGGAYGQGGMYGMESTPTGNLNQPGQPMPPPQPPGSWYNNSQQQPQGGAPPFPGQVSPTGAGIPPNWGPPPSGSSSGSPANMLGSPLAAVRGGPIEELPFVQPRDVWSGVVIQKAKRVAVTAVALRGDAERYFRGVSEFRVRYRQEIDEVAKKPFVALCYFRSASDEHRDAFGDLARYFVSKQRAGVVSFPTERKETLYLVASGSDFYEKNKPSEHPPDMILGFISELSVAIGGRPQPAAAQQATPSSQSAIHQNPTAAEN
eukprot:GHVN01020856.1.p1 GENE.GHVN01020856.1~~GHVN01020856.1.p1  ORF type:complete len:665 (+),score=96.15 GHVN01020856.1:186-2180(+)